MTYPAAELVRNDRWAPTPADSRYDAVIAILEAQRCPALPSRADLTKHMLPDRSDEEVADAWTHSSTCKLWIKINAEIRQVARRDASFLVKCRARRYRERPIELEAIAPGLAAANGTRLIAWGQHFLEHERAHPQRGFGFGGEVKALNAKACILAGRYLRRFGDRPREPA